jgi:hypothetical protein
MDTNKRYREINPPRSEYDYNSMDEEDDMEMEEYDESKYIEGDTYDYVYEELTNNLGAGPVHKNYMVNENIKRNQEDSNDNYWRNKLLELLGKQKSKIHQFANMLANLIQLPLSEVLSEFPKDFITPNVQIKQLLQNLLSNLHTGSSSKEWYQKQIVIRSILASIEEYRNEFIKEEDKNNKPKKNNTSSDKLEDEIFDKANIANTVNLKSAVSMLTTSFDANKSKEDINNNVNNIDKYEKNIISTLQKLIESLNTFKDSENGLTIESEVYKNIIDLFQKIYVESLNIVKFNFAVEIPEYENFVDNILMYFNKIQNKEEDNLIPTSYIPDIIYILGEFKDCFNILVSNRQRNQNTLNEISGITDKIKKQITRIRTKYTENRIERIYDKYNYILASNNYKLFKNEKNKSDVTELISWLNDLDNRGVLKKSFINPWATSEDSIAVVFFTERVYGFLLIAQKDINLFGKNDFKLMELITSEDSAFLVAKYVSYIYQQSQNNERKKTMESTKSLIYGSTRWQITEGRILTKSIVIYMKNLQRVIIKDETTGQVLGTKIVLINKDNLQEDNNTVLGIRKLTNNITQLSYNPQKSENPEDPIWG